jgi:hypothetical protein
MREGVIGRREKGGWRERGGELEGGWEMDEGQAWLHTVFNPPPSRVSDLPQAIPLSQTTLRKRPCGDSWMLKSTLVLLSPSLSP